jgi:hypothetical protein
MTATPTFQPIPHNRFNQDLGRFGLLDGVRDLEDGLAAVFLLLSDFGLLRLFVMNSIVVLF